MEQVVLVGIGGGSCSGKTTLAKRLAQRLGSVILPIDSYYRDLSLLSASERDQWNFDHPDALEWPLLVRHLDRLAAGQSILRPEYDFTTHTRRAEGQPVEPTRVVLVEGILALYEHVPETVYQYRVFVDAPEELRLERRIQRDVVERGRTAESVRRQFRKTVQPMHSRFVQPTLLMADLVVDGSRPVESLLDEVLGAGFNFASRQ